MDPNGSQWILLDLAGSRWVTMDLDGSLWVLMGPNGSRLGYIRIHRDLGGSQCINVSRWILPECLRTGVITLLEKKGKDRLDIANWRPITLLGIDYKLLTKTLGERLKLVLPGLIHQDQNGFVPGGNIFFSAHTIRDILFYCKKENLDLILLSILLISNLFTKHLIFLTLGGNLNNGSE